MCLAGCAQLGEGPPTDVVLTAASDTTIRVNWTLSGGSLPDSYVVAFMETGTASWVDCGTARESATAVDHNPSDRTGQYRVTALFGGRSYAASTTPSSAPIHIAAINVGELNSPTYSGYGWNRDSGGGTLFTMLYASNADHVDFYITDWATGFAGPDYYVASPDWGPYEPGGAGVVPVGPWRPDGFMRVSADVQSPLPAFDPTRYANNARLDADSTIMAVVCTDTTVTFDTIPIIDTTSIIDTTFVVDTIATPVRHYALVRLGSPDAVSGTVPVETWFQLISDLRLIQH